MYLHKDPRFSILSPRQTPSLLTSVSQVMTPNRVPHIYTSSQQTNPIFNHLAHGLSTSRYSVVGNDTKNMFDEKNSKTEPTEREIFSERYLGVKSEPINIEDDTKPFTVTDRNNSELFLENLERQIISDTSTLTDIVNHQDCTDADSYLPKRVQTRNPVHHDNTIKELGRYSNTEMPIYSYHRSHSSSLSSNAETNHFTSLSTRCSECDGCSSTESSIHPLHVNLPACNYQRLSGFSERSRNCSEGSTFSAEVDSYMYNKTGDDTCVGLISANMDLDMSNITQSSRSANVLMHKHDACSQELMGRKRSQCPLNHYPGHGQNSLGHVVVLATWIQLSKIKELQSENVKQRQTVNECKRKVDSLILTVLVLSKQMKSSVCRLQSNHVHLDQIKEAQRQYEYKLKRLQYGFVCLAVLYVFQLSSFRTRCLSIIRFFGILELISKINRTRKMISKNWWNIPSLLTDFWRIFIFRSRSRLRDRFS